MAKAPVSGPGKRTREAGEAPELVWRMVNASPSVQEQLTRAQALAIKEVLQWWTRHAAQSRSTSSPEEPTAADPQG
ncbi:hypothetical protein E1293_42680 [Actinomadura darangshiensis]|uniref:Uncharacterized protein n=1 Tax=Actinomadura darangshiensis TaxID=705336 RepID=A0A4R4ZWV0_9ACTN|nr:hypothetical protein E1293_42680 [Actinomadura darangshiensis]